MSSSGIPVGQLLSLAKRFLFPQVRKWLKERKKRKQQQQQQQQQSSYSQQQHPPAQQQQQQQQGGYYQQPPQQQGGYNYSSSNQYQPQQQPQQYQQGYQSQQQPNYASAGAASAYYGGSQAPVQQSYQSQPQHPYKPPQHVNVDSQNASDPHYVQLRNQAIREDDLMGQAFDAASEAYKSGDGARAKELSNQGKAHQRRKEELNDQAADWIFAANNQNQPRGSIDLHGLYVQEAIERTERAVQDAQSQGLSELRIITGKGIHSNQGIAKIKPAIEKLMVKYHLSAHLDQHNSGVLIVNLAGGGGGSRDLGWVDQADRDSEDGQCTIM